jgi:hypothetical protein
MSRLLTLVVCLAAPLVRAAADRGGGRLEIIDAAENCSEFYRQTAGATPEQQAQAFEKFLRAPHPTLYTSKVLLLTEPFSHSVPEQLEKAARFRPDPTRVEEVRRTLDADLQDAAVQFRKTFPDFTSKRPVAVVCSLGGFDGGTREVEGAQMLLFGPDVIAAIRPRGFKLRPFLEHELFHVHHGNLHPDAPETVGWQLWEEGLATYVSAALNPGATADEVSVSDALVAEATPRLPELSRRLLAHLDDPDSSKTYAEFFLGSLEKADVPLRSGYLIGWRIAEALGRTRSLAELARMSPAQVRVEVESALHEMARQPPPSRPGTSSK